MLASLKIKDIAIMDELDINFCPHLNIITGETGAACSLCRQDFFVKKEIRYERIDEIARMLGVVRQQ